MKKKIIGTLKSTLQKIVRFKIIIYRSEDTVHLKSKGLKSYLLFETVLEIILCI